MTRSDRELPAALVRFLRTAAIPWRLGWSIANARGWLGEAPVGDEPHLDPGALARWKRELAGAAVYLEYGSGGSTILALREARHVVSVDTDARYLAAVTRRAASVSPGGEFVPIAIDIGRTEKWGRPVFAWPTLSRVARWRRYTAAPWDHLEARGLMPDFVFVDGRFRIACVLESLLRLPDGARAAIMLDDFARRRRGYGQVLEFADGERAGRALVLRRKAGFDREGCLRALAAYQRDPE